MAKRPRDSVEREIMDIIPERFDADSEGLGERRGGHTRLILTIALALLALAAVGVAARHLLVGDGPRSIADANVPVIHPDDKPIKTKPEDRGGMAVPNQDKLVYQDLGKGESGSDSAPAASEKLLPPPEKPQAPVVKSPTPADAAASSAMPPPAAAGSEMPAPPPVAAPSPNQAATQVQPPPAAAAPQPAVQATSLTPVKETGKKDASKPITTASAAPAAPPVPRTAATQVPAAAAPAPASKGTAAPASGGNYQVQLAALKSEGDAQAAWKKALAANKDLLGTLTEDVQRADLGAKGVFFRLRAGPLDEAAAKSLCAELTKRNQVCIVAKK